MTRAAGEAFDELRPGKRTLMFSRSSYIGMHRYGGVWTGDNASWWAHLQQVVKQQVGLNMAGFMFNGSDTGGFSGNTTRGPDDQMAGVLDVHPPSSATTPASAPAIRNSITSRT